MRIAIMYTNDQILAELRRLLTELFEIPPEKVTPQAHLYTDLDIDSIDAIDLMMSLKDFTGKKLQPEQFKHVRTVQDVVDAVANLLAEKASS
jgi:acyl carrier protein